MKREATECRDEKHDPTLESSGRKPRGQSGGAASVPVLRDHTMRKAEGLLERVVANENMQTALARVKKNKGAPGVDRMTVDELDTFLARNWPSIKEELLDGRYKPKPVKRKDIPKPGGGTRVLGIPTVLDRLIQQAIHQVLQPIWEPLFSSSSYGFRPRRGAHQALIAAKAHVTAGHRWIVDIDLEKFFDKVNHDVLMARVACRIDDKPLLKLIRKFLTAGMMVGGLETQRVKGTPQGGPLSPLLSNILLDDLDKELERRGHRFCRYADDCNIYVKSRRAGERVMETVTHFLEVKLRLKVNRKKSAVDRPWKRKFLGYSMTAHKRPRLKVAKESIQRFKQERKRDFRKGRGRNLEAFMRELAPKLRGWVAYYKLAEVKGVFEELDGWIRRRLRAILWRQWKRPFKRYTMLRKRGIPEETARKSAWNGRGPWWNSGKRHMNFAYPADFFIGRGLISLSLYKLSLGRMK